MNTKHLSIICLAVGILVLAGCAPTRIALEPSFWDEKEATIGLAVATYPPVTMYTSGGGLLDMALIHAISGELKFFLQEVDPSSFAAILERFEQKLTEKGYTVKIIDGLLDLEQLQNFTTQATGHYSKVDFRPLAEDEHIDILCIFTIQRMGTQRPYYGFIPLGPPKALCQAKGELIDLDDNRILWLNSMIPVDSTLPIPKPWNQPPDYPNLQNALDKTIDNAIQVLDRGFPGD